MQKHVSLIALATFLVVWKEINKRAFRGVEDDFEG